MSPWYGAPACWTIESDVSTLLFRKSRIFWSNGLIALRTRFTHPSASFGGLQPDQPVPTSACTAGSSAR